jgi:hypothetical protein
VVVSRSASVTDVKPLEFGSSRPKVYIGQELEHLNSRFQQSTRQLWVESAHLFPAISDPLSRRFRSRLSSSCLAAPAMEEEKFVADRAMAATNRLHWSEVC